MYSFDDLFLFVKIIKVGSFTGTAKLFKISQSTISRRMQSLEEQLGIALFKQHNKGFELTEIGKALYASFMDKDDETDELINKWVKHKYIPQGTIKVVLPPVLAMDLISPSLPYFLEKYPQINLDVCYQTQSVDLIKDGFDVVIEAINHTQTTSRAISPIRQVFSSEYGLYCSKQYKTKYGIPKTPQDLQKHFVTGVMLDNYRVAGKAVFTHLQTKTVTFIEMPGQLASNHATQNQQMMHSHEIIVGLFDYMNLQNNDNIIKVLPDYSMGTVKYYISTHPYQNNFITSLFCDFIENLLNKAAG